MCFLVNAAFAQSRTLTGKVLDDSDQALPGVNIQVKGTTTGTATDVNGAYSISVGSADDVLVFSFIGYKSREIQVGNRTEINLKLEADVASLREIVVVGYGTQRRDAVTTSITKLDEKVLENVPFSNVASAMQGALSGVRVQSTSGQPGAAPRVIVRGGTSINNPNGASPLYIVDGIIRTNLDNLSANDIESLQVLKDAASTAIYGARGSNGVVIVTTKSGKAGRTQVTYSFNHTTSKVGKMYDLVNARQYLELNRGSAVKEPDKTRAGAVQRLSLPMGYGTGNDLTNNTAFSLQYLTPENEYKLQEGWQSMPDPADPSKTLLFADNDFQALNYQTGISQNHHLSVSGGTEKATFHAGLGYLDDVGTVITTGYKRLSFELNGDLKVRDNLKFFGRVIYSNSQQRNSAFSTAITFYRSAGLAPTGKLYFEDGTLAPGTNNGIGNPLYQMKTMVNRNSLDNLTIAAGGSWEILPGLSFDPQVSLFNTSNDGYSFQPAFWNGPASFVTTRNASASNSRWRQYQADAVLSYKKSISDQHNFDVKAGLSYFSRQQASLSAAGRGASTDLIPTLNAAGEPTSVNSSISDQVIVGYFGRINYDFREKYLLSVNARYDGASNLGNNYRWGFFPGVSAGWNLHNEEFWTSLPKMLSTLKLRTSYGVNGNISGLSDFQAQGAYSVGARYNGQAAIQNTVLPNPDLKWEQSKTFDVGLDAGLFGNRVSVLFDYFRRRTDNLITSLSLPRSTGFASILTNLGSLENKGVELEISARLLPVSAPWQWQASLNASRIRNKILKLPDNGTPGNRVGGDLVWDGAAGDYVWKGGLQEGGNIGDMYSLRQEAIYATDEDAAKGPVYTYIVGADKTQYGGDVRFHDADGNGSIDSRDQVYMGNTYPLWTGGFSNTLSYRGFSLYVRMDYTTGHTIFNYGKLFLDMNGYSDGSFTKDKYDNSWKNPGDIATQSRYYWGGERTQRNNFFGVSDRGNSIFYQKGDFLCLRELTLSYSVPSEFLKKIRISGLRLSATGSNLHYFTGYDGLNPEEGGRDDGRYPMPKSYIFGASISF
ncbi:TonB-dependent receptor [Ravibacter arvi]|uniref:TonB-dependent receptor n=1 Tax=Ravibacter arvi TaxID=2051041 RepID=A0ABP8MAP1_9BACT